MFSVCARPAMLAWGPMETGMPTVDHFYTTVTTDLGAIGMAWTRRGLRRVMLPAKDREATLRRLLAGMPDACEVRPEGVTAEVAAALARYAAGERVDFTFVPLDPPATDRFHEAIYRALCDVGYGETTTYGALCAAAGFPTAARETGTALGRNPVPIVVPCHRVLAAGGALGGFSAPGGVDTKRRLLTLEGYRFAPARPVQASFAF